jgi:Tol biopolymer transport system component
MSNARMISARILFTIALVFAVSTTSAVAATPETVTWLYHLRGDAHSVRALDDGTQQTTVGNPNFRPTAQSPDGQTLAFVQQSEPGAYALCDCIMVSGAAGASRKMLLQQGGWGLGRMVFSPDLKYLYYESFDSPTNRDIWRAPLDGSPATPFITDAINLSGLSFSADGTRITYMRGYDNRWPDVFTAAGDGSNPQPITISKAQFPGSYRDVAINPAGTQIAFAGSTSSTNYYTADVYTMNINGTGLKRLTATSTKDEGEISWSPDGTKLIFAAHTPSSSTAPWTISTIKTDGTGLVNISSLGGGGELRLPAYRPARTVANYDQLLDRYAPLMAYDQGEQYYADSAAEITDAPSNKLHHVSGSTDTTLAAHDVVGMPELSLDYLGQRAATSSPTEQRDDQLDETNSNPTPAEEAASLHGVDTYRHHVYGRAVRDAAGKWWIQYWYSYYYDDVPAEPTSSGEHEGDWEMVQIGFAASGIPDTATFAQHKNGMRCGWSQVDRNAASGVDRLVVYPAAGAHASYPKAGVWGSSTVHPIADYAEGNDLANRVVPSVESITSPPAWSTWGGHWGNTLANGTPGAADSPPGPMFQGSKWTDPGAWSVGVNQCDVNPAQPFPGAGAAQFSRARHLLPGKYVGVHAPSVPSVSIHTTARAGLSLRYVTHKNARAARTTALMVTMVGKHHASLTRYFAVRQSSGTVKLATKVIKDVSYMRVRVFAADGLRSRVAALRRYAGGWTVGHG